MTSVRGDLYRLRAPRDAIGHEQHGERFAVVVQSDLLSAFSTVLIAPTSTSAREADFRPTVEINGKDTKVLLDQTTAVDPQRLGEFAGRLSPEETGQIDTALRIGFGLLW
ncbi:type II toxin-antitoxin system PemK/MazF family toxin [Planomonospora algeriensis]